MGRRPHGPLFIARRDNDGDMELLKDVFGRDAIERAYQSEGGHQTVQLNAAVARLLQLSRAEREGGTEAVEQLSAMYEEAAILPEEPPPTG